jgi:hypothetical protein
MKAILALKRIFIAGAIAGTLAAAPAWARPQEYNFSSYMNGNRLLAQCTSADAAAVAECIGYVEGVTEAVVDTTNRAYFGPKGSTMVPIEPPPYSPSRVGPILACLPAGPGAQGSSVTTGQLKDIAVKYLQANPAERHVSAFNLVSFALREAFPCPK